MDTRLWTDGRTGKAGQVAGNLVLSDIAKGLGPIEHWKGTIFVTSTEIIIARVNATTRYLMSPEVHWSTFEPDQERSLRSDPRFTNQKFHYLFVTARERAVFYWLIPSRVIMVAVEGIAPRRDGAIFVRIREDEEGKTFLYNKEITRYSHRLALDGELSATMQHAQEGSSGRERERPHRAPREAAGGSQGRRNASPGDTQTMHDSLVQPTAVVIERDGSVILPQSLRRQLSLSEGTRAVAFQEGQRIILQPVRANDHRHARGSLKGKGAFKVLIEQRQQEREL
jgi:bifunctional DNA-binding transcriptional regulator/antitoxin component of YhaV-PrlF toxin-antitoxin module